MFLQHQISYCFSLVNQFFWTCKEFEVFQFLLRSFIHNIFERWKFPEIWFSFSWCVLLTFHWKHQITMLTRELSRSLFESEIMQLQSWAQTSSQCPWLKNVFVELYIILVTNFVHKVLYLPATWSNKGGNKRGLGNRVGWPHLNTSNSIFWFQKMTMMVWR